MLDKIGVDTILNWLNDNQSWTQEDGAHTYKDFFKPEAEQPLKRHLETGLCKSSPLDQNTLRWRSWSSPGGQNTTSALIPSEGEIQDATLQTLTSTEFRKLRSSTSGNESLRALHGNVSKPPRRRNHGDPVFQTYRSQLVDSLRAFRDRQWTPYEGDFPGPDPVMPPRSRPPSSVSESRLRGSRPPSSRFVSSHRRPNSSPPTRHQHNSDKDLQLSDSILEHHLKPSKDSIENQNQTRQCSELDDHFDSCITREPLYDTLTPDLVFELSDRIQPESVYGDRPESALSRLEDVELDLTDSRPSTATLGISRGTTPHQDLSSARKPRTPSLDRLSTAHSDRETDLESDEEDYPEPQVVQMNLDDLPSLSLRPEKIDTLDVPIYERGDRRKYDFDASVVDDIPFEFADPLSEPLQMLDLAELSRSDKDWRQLTSIRPSDKSEELLVDRLIELERLQQKTVEVEKIRQERQRAIRARHTKSRVYPMSRVHSAKTWRERKCCTECVQASCVGDCPAKPPTNSTTCLLCSEKDCNGNCSQNVYDSRARSEAPDERMTPTPPQRPKSCGSCQSRHNAKLINANNLILGRPKSGNATFSRGQSSHTPKDLRLSLADVPISSELEKQFESIGLDSTASKPQAVSRPSTANTSRRRHAGRAGVLPGKSYCSQRRVSLTGRDSRYEKARQEAIKHIRAARRNRPKTAA